MLLIVGRVAHGNDFLCVFRITKSFCLEDTLFFHSVFLPEGSPVRPCPLAEHPRVTSTIFPTDTIDIVRDPISPGEYKPEEDPKLYRSAKTGRGPLGDDWLETAASGTLMCAYKLCKVEFRYWGMQSKIEQFIHDVGEWGDPDRRHLGAAGGAGLGTPRARSLSPPTWQVCGR